VSIIDPHNVRPPPFLYVCGWVTTTQRL